MDARRAYYRLEAALKRSFEDVPKPSKFLHRLRMVAAMLGDLIDIVATLIKLGLLVLTGGVGSIVTQLIDMGIDVLINIFLFVTEIWIDQNKKKLTAFQGQLLNNPNLMREARQPIVVDSSRIGAKPGQERARQATQKLNSLMKNRVIAKSGWLKGIIQYLLDLVPVLELIPWRTLGVRGRNKKYLKAYAETKQMVEMILAQKWQEVLIFEYMEKQEREMALQEGM